MRTQSLISKYPKIDISIIFLILANLAPVWGVFFMGWDAASMLMLYWAENLVVGFYSLLKIAFAGSLFWNIPSKLGTMIFFLFHYSAFTAVHGMFLVSFLKIGDGDVFTGGHDAGIFVFLLMLKWTFLQFMQSMPVGTWWSLLALLLSHGFSFFYNYLSGKEYENTTPKQQMGQPYGRIVILHIVVLAGGIAMQGVSPGSSMLILLVVLKVVLDVTLHLRTHKQLDRDKVLE